MKNVFYYETKIGKLAIAEDENGITNICVPDDLLNEDINIKETKLIKKAANQIEEYLSGKRKGFDIKLSPKGTDFQNLVWNELKNIEYGNTNTYKDIATKIGKPKAARAVGGANNKNPILIIIPCHRVIGANKSLTGYSAGIDMKKMLLDIESSYVE